MADAWIANDFAAPSLSREMSILPLTGRSIALPDASRHGIFGFDSRDRRSRPFNLLRSQVLKQMKARNWKIVGVTSPTPNVGKTFIASNLAASLSRIPGQRVMLVDLDLRRGSVAKQFGINSDVGIEGYLAGESGLQSDMVLDVENSGLTIIPSNPTGKSSAEMLASAQMRLLVTSMRGLGDEYLCICDMPPVFANDDTAIVTREIDSYLLVVEEGKTTKRQMIDAVDVLKPAPCLGTVLNRYRGALGGDDYGFGYWSQRNYNQYYG